MNVHSSSNVVLFHWCKRSIFPVNQKGSPLDSPKVVHLCPLHKLSKRTNNIPEPLSKIFIASHNETLVDQQKLPDKSVSQWHGNHLETSEKPGWATLHMVTVKHHSIIERGIIFTVTCIFYGALHKNIMTQPLHSALKNHRENLQPSVVTPGVCKLLEGGICSAHFNTILHDFYVELVLQTKISLLSTLLHCTTLVLHPLILYIVLL